MQLRPCETATTSLSQPNRTMSLPRSALQWRLSEPCRHAFSSLVVVHPRSRRRQWKWKPPSSQALFPYSTTTNNIVSPSPLAPSPPPVAGESEDLGSSSLTFRVLHASRRPGSRARVGRIGTPHGHIDTPNFVGVGTHASMKALTPAQALDTGLQLMFCNTYHLGLHPGPEVVAAAGGLHAFMGWARPLITDSGPCFVM